MSAVEPARQGEEIKVDEAEDAAAAVEDKVSTDVEEHPVLHVLFSRATLTV